MPLAKPEPCQEIRHCLSVRAACSHTLENADDTGLAGLQSRMAFCTATVLLLHVVAGRLHLGGTPHGLPG